MAVADLYVKATGSDSTGTGSLGSPYATLAKAWSVISGAQRVIGVIGNIGSASVDCVLDGKTGTSGNPYIVCGADAGGTLLVTPIGHTRPAWMPQVLGKIRVGAAVNTTYLTLRQMELDLAITPAGPGLLPLDCDHLEIDHCVVTNHNQAVGVTDNSIAINAGFSGTPSNLWIHHSWLVDIGDMTNDTVQVEPSGWFSHAIYLESVTAPLVEHCVIKHVSGRGLQLFGGSGVSGGIYRYCLFDDCGMAVIVDSHAVNNTWTGNLFTHTRNYQVIQQGSSYTGSGNVRDANAYYSNLHGNGTFLPDAHAVTVASNPFTDYAGGDLSLINGSPAVGYGPDFLQPVVTGGGGVCELPYILPWLLDECGTPPPPPPPPPPPAGITRPLLGTVGCSDYELIVYPRGLPPRIVASLDYPGWTALTWEHRLNQKAAAVVTFQDLTKGGKGCLSAFAAVRKWQHELVIIRRSDGIIWSGPITGRFTQSGSGTINAWTLDVWLDRRDLLKNHALNGELADSYAELWHDAIDRNNDMGYELVVDEPTGLTLALQPSKAADHVIASSALQPLMDDGLDVVTIGRTTTIGAPSATILTPQLVDDHVSVFPDVSDDGLYQANRYGVYAGGAQGGNKPQPYQEATRADLIARDGELVTIEQNQSISTRAEAALLSQQRSAAFADPAPDAQTIMLAPEAPFTLSMLHPGRVLDVRIYQAPISLDGYHRITRVFGSVDTQSGGEQIGVELVPYIPGVG